MTPACLGNLIGIDISIGMQVRKPHPPHVVVVRRREGRQRWAGNWSKPRRIPGTDRWLGAGGGSGRCGRAPTQDEEAA